MYREYCEICGQPIKNIDFYVAVKGGAICPACLLRQNVSGMDDEQEHTKALEQTIMLANRMNNERQVFF